jgi:transcriptional regulator with XRE-family HTH domain
MTDYKEVLYKIIGERIKSQREDLNISQLELSQKLDISRSSISNIEVGRHQIPLYLLYQISKEMNIDIKNLLPDYSDIIKLATTNETDYSTYLRSETLNEDVKEKLNNMINNI